MILQNLCHKTIVKINVHFWYFKILTSFTLFWTCHVAANYKQIGLCPKPQNQIRELEYVSKLPPPPLFCGALYSLLFFAVPPLLGLTSFFPWCCLCYSKILTSFVCFPWKFMYFCPLSNRVADLIFFINSFVDASPHLPWWQRWASIHMEGLQDCLPDILYILSEHFFQDTRMKKLLI